MKEKLMDVDSSQNTTTISGTEALWMTNEQMYVKGSVGINIPKYTWKCQLIHGTFWMVEEHQVPNWFHRKMQTLWFGIKWIKV